MCVCVICKSAPQWVAQMWFVCNPLSCHSSSLTQLTHPTNVNAQYMLSATQNLTREHHMKKTCHNNNTTCPNDAKYRAWVVKTTNNGQVMWSDENNAALTWWRKKDARDARVRCFVLRWEKCVARHRALPNQIRMLAIFKAAHFTCFKRCLIVVAELTWNICF